MKENKNFLLVGILITIMLVGIVSAEEIEFQPNQADNFIGRIVSFVKYNIFQVGTFTVYGDTLGCSKYPNEVKLGNSALLNFQPNTITFYVSEGTGFVNWFRGSPNDGTYEDHLADSRQFLGEQFIKKGETATMKCDAGAYWDYDCYGEIYYCPTPCYSDSDCVGFCDKSILSQKIENAGVCKTSEEQENIIKQVTKVYRCENGQKTFLEDAISGNVNFCTNPLDSKYLIGSTDQCLSYEPTICREVPNVNVQEGILEYDIPDATIQELLSSVCTESQQCKNNSQCKSLQSLTDSGIISDINANEIAGTISGAIISATGGLTAGIGLTLGCTALLAIPTGPISIPICLAVGAAGGTGAGLGLDKFFDNIAEKKLEKTGLCISSGGGIKFFEDLALFRITGNKQTDGMIVLFGGIVSILILFSLLGGGKK